MAEELDLGYDHKLRFTSWSPDRDLNPQYEGIEDVDRFGAIIDHKKPNGDDCSGAMTFDSPTARALNEIAKECGFREMNLWTVESWEPLTASPSFLCCCGDHGFIRDGKWVPA